MTGLGPYSENTIVCGDCLDVMAELPDGCVDLVVTDPPYGKGLARCGSIGGDHSAPVTNYGPQTWDDKPLSIEQFREMCRVSKAQIIFGANYYDFLPPSPCWLIWDKRRGGQSDNFADCELAWTSFNSPSRVFSWRWRGMIRDGHDERLHPTQKPERLLWWILTNYSAGGDLVADFFMGSGTTAVAADRLGRKWFGCDLNGGYVEMALDRIHQDRLRRSQLELPL